MLDRSRVNNAVARVAGLACNCNLGMVMVSAFGYQMNQGLMQLGLQSNEIKLAALAQPLPSVSIDRAFVFAFRLIMLICASLSLTSAAFAGRTIATNAMPFGSVQGIE